MAKQNVAVSLGAQLRGRADATVNHEGGLAFTLDARTRLYTRACASLMREDKFYTDAAQADGELLADVQAVAVIDPEFVLRLAAYVRQVMNLRSTPVAMLVAAAAVPACKPFVRKWTPEIVRRADEPGEVIAWWVKLHGQIGSHGAKGGEHAFPNSLTRGLEDALSRFDEYQFGKYDRDDAQVKLRDVLRIVRPKPVSDAQSALFRFVVKGELDATHLPKMAAKAALLRKTEFDAEARDLAAQAHATWEVLISKFGGSAATWNALHLPFMAGMRNLSNLMRNGADEALDRVMAMFRNPRHVARSKQLPFRFFSAYRAVESAQRFDRKLGYTVQDEKLLNHPRRAAVLEALLAALDASVVNLPRLHGRTFITTDNSASMQCPVSDKSTVQRVDVANLLGAIAHTMCDEAICSVFGDTHAVVPVVRNDSVLTNMGKLAGTDVGCSTNAYLTIRHLREKKIRVDRIVLFSDMQCYESDRAQPGSWSDINGSLAVELAKYRSSVNPEVFLYSVDLAGYGTSQFPQSDRRVAMLAGWSERLLEFISLFEADGLQAVDRISQWDPATRARAVPAPLESDAAESSDEVADAP
jgi:hypothetical protein